VKINSVTKSITGALIAGLGALQVASADGVVTSMEWTQIGSATLAALILVWGVRNTDVPAVPEKPVAP